MTTRLTVDVQDRAEEIQERLNELSGEIGSLESQFHELQEEFDPDEYDVDEVENTDEYQELNEEFRDLKQTEQKLTHAREQIQQDIEDWDGSEFVIKKPRWGESGQINDLVLAEMARDNIDDPQGKYEARKRRTVQVCVVETPPEAPDNPAKFSNPVGEYLYQQIEALNEYGEVDMQDFSLSASANDSDEQQS